VSDPLAGGALRGLLLGVIERRHPPGYRGAVVERLVPLLREAGAGVELVHAELGMHRLDEAPPWDLVVLKSGSTAALHLAAAAEGWGVPSVNPAEATRLAQDKLAGASILQSAGLPIAPAHTAWLGPTDAADGEKALGALRDRPVVVKAARGSRGVGLWTAEAGELGDLAAKLPAGPYLIMEMVPHVGDDLKVYVAGGWMAAIERPFPATSLEEKLGRPADVPEEVAEATREAGRLLGLTCYGCDFVRGPDGWVMVDVNAFPGYKGVDGAAEALVEEISRAAEVVLR
jgi:ribosomal protein S6--L-glutamate ligase